MSATVTSVATVVGSIRRISFQITGAGVSEPTLYKVSVAGATATGQAFASANTANLTINPAAAISFSPESAGVGQQVSVSILGQYTNFVQGSTKANFGPGISVGGAAEGAYGPVTVINSTSATAQLTVNPQLPMAQVSAVGLDSFSAQAVSLNFDSLTPGTVIGETYRSQGVVFANAAVASDSSAPSSPNKIVSVNSTPLQILFPSGVKRVGIQIDSDGFCCGRQPQIRGYGANGELLATQNFEQGPDFKGFEATTGLIYAIELGSTLPGDPASFTFTDGYDNLVFDTSPATVATGVQQASALFTISFPPTLVRVSPNAGQQGQQNLQVAITGQFTNFVQGITQVSFGGGVAVTSVTVTDPTHLAAQITIDPNAILGSRTVTLTTGIETASLINGFTVTSGASVLTQVNPNTGQQGHLNLSVAITGQFTHFAQGTSEVSFGDGIATNVVSVTDATHLSATITIAGNATLGPRTVTVTTGTETVSLAGGFGVVAQTNQPPIVSAGPDETITLSSTELAFSKYPIPTGNSGTEPITAGPDGNLWFTENLANKIGRITTDGMITEFSIPTNSSHPEGITAAPDGNLWFTEYSGQKIGKITTAGVFTEYPLPTGGSYPIDITTGPDGNLWFTERFGNKIGKITAAGVITEFPVPSPDSEPFGITAGPDSNLWFTECACVRGRPGGNTIGRITTGGVITEFETPTSNSAPNGITPGPDGNIWFVESYGNKIGRMTPAGVIAEFEIPTSSSQPFEITAGPDGNLWFTEVGAGNIGRITPAGVFTEFPSGDYPTGITVGSDGNLWLVQDNNIESVNLGVFPGPVSITLTGSVTDDGLPTGGTLTTTWSEISGPSPVSFGTPTATFPDVADQLNPVVTSATFSTPGTYVFSLTGSDSQLSGSASVTVTVNPMQIPAVLLVNPNTGLQGQQNLSLNITGQFTHFAQGTTTASFGTGITLALLTVNSATSATAVLNISPAATAGPRRVTLTTGTEMATLGNAFTVQASLNQPPIVSAGCDVTVSLPLAQLTFSEYPLPAAGSKPNGISVGPDCSLWFAEPTANKIGRVTTAGVITEFPVPTAGGSPNEIVAGPDGNLWFTEYFGLKIGRVTPAGVFTEFPIPTSNSFPSGIIGGPDGNLWFTESGVQEGSQGPIGGNKIGRITPAGVITEFAIPTGGSGPYEITAGPDGNLWFTESLGNKIGRITPAGAITEFPVPTGGSNPLPIALGSDGNLWFGEYSPTGNKIGRITPAGVITEFLIPTSASQPNGITPGPDGNLWFTEAAGQKIARITTAGVITEFSPPTGNSTPAEIIQGPDGNLWFTELSGNKIGRANAGIFLSGNITDDGLPAGATLSATWSETSGPSAVSFGTPTATFPDMAGQTNLMVTLATFSTSGTYVLTLTGSDSQLSNSSNVTVTVIPPPGVPAILSVNPNVGNQGQQNLSVSITGQFTHFVQGTTVASFGAGISVSSLTINSATNATAVLNIDPAAVVGARTVTVTTGNEVVAMLGGFTVTAPTNQPPQVSAGSNQTITLPLAPTTMTEHLVPTSGTFPRGITVGSDGNLWFTEDQGQSIGRVTPAGVITEFPVFSGPFGAGATEGITNGPDGNIWFTEYTRQAIGRITPTGAITEFSLANRPYGITAGPDGNLWFAERSGNNIGRITPAGAITEFPIPSPNSNPTGITAGPDGNLWFAELFAENTNSFGNGKIGRITPAGVITEFSIPTTAGAPVDITAGPDGNLWFTEAGGNKIGKITPAGAITEFPIPTVNSEPGYITTGPDGNLWFTEDFSSKIGRITPSGVITEFPTPAASSRPQGITVGPDCQLWFAEGTGNKIAKMIPGVVVPVTMTLTGSLTDDGLPLGAMLTATWNVVSGATAVSFGTPTATFLNIAGQTNPVTTSATFCRANPYVLSLTGSDSLLSSSSNVAITINAPPIPTTPTIVSVNPNAGVQGQQNVSVTIAGQLTNFVQGTSQVSFGPGITVTSVTVSDSSSLTAQISIDPNATLGTRTVTVTTGAETASQANAFTVTAPAAGPSITQVSPNAGPQGQGGPLGVVGLNTHFVQGVTTLDLGPGISVSSVTVTCDTCLTAQVVIAANAVVGPRTVTATTGAEVAQLTNGFTVLAGTPILTSMVPAARRQGQSVTSTITGQFTNWVQGTTTVNLGAGVAINSVTVSSSTSLTVQLTVDSAAALGLRNLTVTTGAEVVSATNVFNVLAGLPVVTQANPNTGQQSQSNLSVAITGQFTNFAQGTSQVSFGAGITVNSVTVASLTSLTANISIASNAAPGPRTVTVTTGAEVASLASGFTVLSTTPVLVTVDPNTGQPGQSGPVTITGQSTHFVQGTSQVSFGAGITVGTVTVASSTSLTVQITITANASVGNRTVTVATGGEVASLTNGFTIQAGTPILTFIDPSGGQQGQSLPVALTGQFTNWVQGTTTVSLGADITVGTVTITDSTHLTAQVSIAANAALGSRTATVTTGTEIESAADAFDVVAAGPRLVSASPNTGQEGQSNLSVAITGLNTHFVQGTSQATFGSTAVTVNSITVTDATHLTANISIAINAAPVARTIVITTGAEIATLPNGFTVTPGTNQPPVITIAPTWSVTLPNRLALTYTVTDDGLPFGGTLTTSWDTITTPAGATVGYLNQTTTSISAGFSDPGTYTLRITSTDTQFTVFQDVNVTVTGNPIEPPTVSLTSPIDGAEITAPVSVVGTADSPNLQSWTLEFKPIEETVYRTLASGTTPVTNDVLGTFDPTILLNGLVQIQLSATDTFGQTTTVGPINVVLTKNQKIGNFTVSFNDLSVPVAGLPIQIVRTYDSRSRILGDFGAGWTLDLRTVRLRKNIIEGDQWNATTSGGVFPTYCIQPAKPHVVSVTLPDGTEYTFDLTLTPQCQQLVPPDQVTFGFAPRPGTVASLSILGNNLADVSASFPGTAQLYDSNTAQLFDADRYRLTLPDGRMLDINQATGGLEKMTDLNGNTLTITSAGIIHSSGKSVLFTRDSVGRITQITDPAGNTLNYVYLGGDLFTFTDRENNTTTFGYDGNHGLLSIQDPRGIQPIKNVYDNAGRLIQHIDAFGNVINYTHSLNTHEEIVTDRLNNITVNQYDADGNIVKVTDALGGVTTRTYDSQDNMLTEINPLGKKRTYTYDGQNNRLSETDSLGNTTSYTYNGHGQVLTITDPRLGVTTNVYDSGGNLVSTKDAANNVTSYTYNASGLRTSMTDPLGGVTNYQYDVSGNLTQQTDALGNITTYTYDGNGDRLTETKTRTTTSGPEILVTNYQYDKLSRLTKTTYPDGSTTQIQYNQIGKQSLTIDQLGHQTSYQYDLMGRLTQTNYPDGTFDGANYDAEGDRTSSTDRGGRTTSYEYDPLKRLKKTTYPDTAMTQTTYDAAGQVSQVTDPRGNTATYAYDDAGRRTSVTDALTHSTVFTYDAAGNQASMKDANGNTTQYQYDALNRRTKVSYADTTFDSTAYDVIGRTISKTDQAGQTTQFEYDKLGRLTKVTDALSQITQYTYDELGNRLSQIDANSDTTTFAYDKLGRRTKRTLPLGMFETMTYDAAGDLKTKTDFNGKTTTYAYDNVNRLTSKAPDASFGEPAVSFTYTATGQRQNMVDASGTTAYSYDSRDRLKQKVTPEGTLTYTYDLAGDLATVRSSNAGGTSVDYSYDALNRLSTAKDNRLAAGTTTYTYDNAGNLQGYLYPNGVQSGYSYNALNRLTNMTIAKGSTVASFDYMLGAAGNRTQVTELSGRQVSYTYDALYRLKTETISGGSINGTIGYQYDPVGNRLQRTSTVGPIPAANYSYDANDRLTADSYDQNGNTILSGGNTFTYDFENHLETQIGGTAVNIVYDGDGNRVAKTVSGVTTKYLVDDRNLTGYAQVLEELAGGTVQRVYTYGLNRISQSQASGTSFYGYDGQGNVRLLTDASGAVTDRYDYEAFGGVINTTGTSSNSYLYAGEQFDPQLTLYYLRARYVNQVTGRFITTDPLPPDEEEPLSINRFVYAFNHPTDLHDASGLWPTEIHNALLDAAFSNNLLPADEIAILKSESKNQDALWSRAHGIGGGQSPDLSYQHAMRDGIRHQSLTDAAAQYNNFLQHNLNVATELESLGLNPLHKEALRYIAWNLHAIADSTSPAHRGFQPWNPFDFGAVRDHIALEDTILPSDFISTSLQLRQYYLDNFRTASQRRAAASGGVRLIPEANIDDLLSVYLTVEGFGGGFLK